MLEKTLESPLDNKKIKPVNLKGNQPWIFIGRTDAESEAPILWSPDEKSRLLRKSLDAEKNWGQEEKRMTESELLDGQLSEIVKDREAWDAAVHRVTKSWTWLSNWTTTSKYNKACHVTMLLYLDEALFGWVWRQPSRDSPSGSNKTETNTPCTQFSPQSSQLSSGSPSVASPGCQEQISLSIPSMSVWDLHVTSFLTPASLILSWWESYS